MKLLAIGYLLILTAFTSRHIINRDEISITISKTACGSYQVKNDTTVIGYVVKPFYLNVDDKEREISNFEKLLRVRYGKEYNKYGRAYWFVNDNAKDTLLQVVMLSSEQMASISNWQCEEKDVDTYKLSSKHKFTAKHPQFITYNCSKRRFKIDGDPD